MLVRLLWGVPLVALLLSQPEPSELAKKELKRLEGTWTMAALEVDGKDVGLDRIKDTILTVKGDKYQVKVRNETNGCVIRLDPKKDPPEIDMIFTEPGGGDKVHKGIYKLDGDTFKICRGLNADQERPQQFGTWPNTNYFMVTWKRIP
jgi:uncharacterized protein (TIGR03067 family)